MLRWEGDHSRKPWPSETIFSFFRFGRIGLCWAVCEKPVSETQCAAQRGNQAGVCSTLQAHGRGCWNIQ